MPLRDQSSRRVNRNAATEHAVARFHELATLAFPAKTQHLQLVQLAERRGVVHFGDIDVLGSDAGRLIGAIGRDSAQARFVEFAILAAREDCSLHFDNPVTKRRGQVMEKILGAQDRSRRSVANGSAHRARERLAYQAVGEHLIDRNFEAVLRLRIEGPVIMILRAGDGDLPLRRAILPHVIGGLHGIHVHEDGAVRLRIERAASKLSGPLAGFKRRLGVKIVHPGAESAQYFFRGRAGAE